MPSKDYSKLDADQSIFGPPAFASSDPENGQGVGLRASFWSTKQLCRLRVNFVDEVPVFQSQNSDSLGILKNSARLKTTTTIVTEIDSLFGLPWNQVMSKNTPSGAYSALKQLVGPRRPKSTRHGLDRSSPRSSSLPQSPKATPTNAQKMKRGAAGPAMSSLKMSHAELLSSPPHFLSSSKSLSGSPYPQTPTPSNRQPGAVSVPAKLRQEKTRMPSKPSPLSSPLGRGKNSMRTSLFGVPSPDPASSHASPISPDAVKSRVEHLLDPENAQSSSSSDSSYRPPSQRSSQQDEGEFSEEEGEQARLQEASISVSASEILNVVKDAFVAARHLFRTIFNIEECPLYTTVLEGYTCRCRPDIQITLQPTETHDGLARQIILFGEVSPTHLNTPPYSGLSKVSSSSNRRIMAKLSTTYSDRRWPPCYAPSACTKPAKGIEVKRTRFRRTPTKSSYSPGITFTDTYQASRLNEKTSSGISKIHAR